MRKLNFILSCFFLFLAAWAYPDNGVRLHREILDNYSYEAFVRLVFLVVKYITIGAVIGWLSHRQRKKYGYSKNHILTDIAIANWFIFAFLSIFYGS